MSKKKNVWRLLLIRRLKCGFPEAINSISIENYSRNAKYFAATTIKMRSLEAVYCKITFKIVQAMDNFKIKIIKTIHEKVTN